ncbi:hypothetical protein OAA60_01985 [Porticoccaceae bacterium]|jgi:hypothetical protein|nr:hypothetical protein [Porticoccaceae bacterium]
METMTNTELSKKPETYVDYINEEFIDACGSGCKCSVSKILLLNQTISFKQSFEIAFRIALINRHGEILKLLLEIDNTICTTFLDTELHKAHPLDRLDIQYLNKQRMNMGLSEEVKYHSLNIPYEQRTKILCEIELREYAEKYIIRMKKKHPNSPYKRFINCLNSLFQFYTFTYNTNDIITPKLVIERNNFDKCTSGTVAPPIGGLIPIPKQHQHKTKPLGHFKKFSLNMYDSDNIYDEPPPLIPPLLREPRIFNNNVK